MSYDLLFWQQNAEETRSPAEIHDALMASNEPAAGLRSIAVEDFVARCLDEFTDARREPNGAREWIDCSPADASWSFQVEWSPVHISVALRGAWPHEVANRLIDLASEIDCPLYDPQTAERFS